MPCVPLPNWTSRVALFPGKDTDWRGLLAVIMEDPTVKSLAIITQHYGDEYVSRWSGQSVEALAFKGKLLTMASELEIADALEATFAPLDR